MKHSAVGNVAPSQNPHKYRRLTNFVEATLRRHIGLKPQDRTKKRGENSPRSINSEFFSKPNLQIRSQILWTAVRVVPVVLRPPLVRFHIPPLVVLRPAIFTRFRQFMPSMLGLFAVPSMVLDGFVEIVIGVLGAVLAFRFARFHTGCAGEKQKPAESHQRDRQLSVFQNPCPPL
jgi:hypothetical protein